MKGRHAGINNPFYGKHHTDKAKKNISEGNKNRPPITDETRRKISEAKKGAKNPRYGVAVSDETRKKMSEAHKGSRHTEETKRRLSKINKGKRHTEETKQKLRKANLGKKLTEEHKRKIGEGNIGRVVSEETRKIISDGKIGKKNPMFGKPVSAETRRKRSESLKGTRMGEDNPMYGKHITEEHKRIISEYMTGEKHHNWMGGISFEPYSPEFNKALKRKIRDRDNYTCQYLGEPARSVHHIDYDKENTDPANLITLCISCHALSNNNRPYWKRLFTDMIKTSLKFN